MEGVVCLCMYVCVCARGRFGRNGEGRRKSGIKYSLQMGCIIFSQIPSTGVFLEFLYEWGTFEQAWAFGWCIYPIVDKKDTKKRRDEKISPSQSIDFICVQINLSLLAGLVYIQDLILAATQICKFGACSCSFIWSISALFAAGAFELQQTR